MRGDHPEPREQGTPDQGDWAQRRKHRRKPIIWGAELETPEARLQCFVLDVSLGGARLRVSQPIAVREKVSLVFKKFGQFDSDVLSVSRIEHEQFEVRLRFQDCPDLIAQRFAGSPLPLTD